MRVFAVLALCTLLSACASHYGEATRISNGQVIAVGPTRALIGNSAMIGYPTATYANPQIHTSGYAIADFIPYYNFKLSHPELFVANPATEASFDTAEAVNSKINEAIAYDDSDAGKGTEVWHVMADGGNGSCHDYAVTKLAEMVAAGTPRQSLRLTIASVKDTGQWHLMLAVDLPGRGTFFMDNNSQHLLSAAEANDIYTLWFMENPAAQRMELVG